MYSMKSGWKKMLNEPIRLNHKELSVPPEASRIETIEQTGVINHRQL